MIQYGDRIKVTDSGRQYSSWTELANKLGATNWSPATYVKNGDEGCVVAIKYGVKNATSSSIALIRLDSGKEYLMGSGGIEVICEINKEWEGLLDEL